MKQTKKKSKEITKNNLTPEATQLIDWLLSTGRQVGRSWFLPPHGLIDRVKTGELAETWKRFQSTDRDNMYRDSIPVSYEVDLDERNRITKLWIYKVSKPDYEAYMRYLDSRMTTKPVKYKARTFSVN